ncbi:DUF485 domain-containing protein [Bacillus tuaregi]|uniref:DUF485 domain-containing protein n=1 Tax=Bacillus tuaregi TaxID=1816695 RepID=UPI0008F87250|nr:DUF485 domain-containing protein [Bacillus tuaregi]
MDNLAKEGVTQQNKYDFEKIASTPEFKDLMKAKKKFLVPVSIVFLALYFTLPILTSYSTILNRPAIGSISWTWVYSFGLFVMTWVLCMVYVKRAARYDKMAQNIIEKYSQGDQSL